MSRVLPAAAGDYPPDPWRALRYLVRGPLLLANVLVAPLLALAVLNPLAARVRVGATTLDKAVIRGWSAMLLGLFGFRIRRFGEPLPGGVLYVANHVSWLDVVALLTVAPLAVASLRSLPRHP